MFRNLPTFKSFPQAIGLPFLSTQEDAQLKFKSSEEGVKRLFSEEIVPLSDVEYWAQYYRIFSSAADVYSLISVQDIRQALSTQPVNLSNLIKALSYHLFTLLPSPLFPTPSSNSSTQDPTKEALNCLRVLGRILVVVYENDADRKAELQAQGQLDAEETFADKYLWARVPIERLPTQEENQAQNQAIKEQNGVDDDSPDGGQFKIEDSDSEDDDEPKDTADEGEGGDLVDEGARAFKATIGHSPVPNKDEAKVNGTEGKIEDPLSQSIQESTLDATEDKDVTLPRLVDRLFSCTIDLLFCAGFTVPDNVRGTDRLGDKVNYVIWEKGIGSTVSVGSTAELDRNKTEVLRFLMILLSTTIYTPPHALATTPNLPLENITHSLERRLVLSLLCSFLNTSLAPARASGGISGQLPYNHLISKAAEERRTLVRGCLMTLLVALDYRTPTTDLSASMSGLQMGEAKDENAFRYFISKLHRKEDFSFILGGIVGILEEHMAVQNGYLPGSKQPVPYILETFMLLWRMVDLNKRFRAYLFDSGKAPDLIGYVLLTCLEHKDDPAHHGLLRLLSYLLQTMSADQAFASALHQTMRLNVPAKWAVPGNLADFMIVSIYSIATTPGLNPLFPALTISIANSAPYLQNIGVQASTRLMQLFKAFSAPNFLLADEGHPRLVYYLLETFNSILYYQLNENPNLVYAILRSHQDFQTLATFTLVSGLREIQRRKALRAAAAENIKKDDRPGILRTNSELDMLAEKAALLGQTDENEDEAISPTEQRRTPTASAIDSPTPQPLTTPGDLNAPDPLSIQSPTDGAAPPPPPPPITTMSEKARGKMRATESVTSLHSPTESIAGSGADVPDEELMRVAMAGVGPNGYVPTQEWVSSWQKGLPLDPVLVAISELLPKIQDSQSRTGAPSSKVLNLIKGASLVDVLPPAQPIMPRRFQWSSASAVWLTSLLWGDIYVAGLTSIGIWRDTTVRLFGVKQAPAKGRGAQVGRVLKRLGVV